jgi:hypothetical protein
MEIILEPVDEKTKYFPIHSSRNYEHNQMDNKSIVHVGIDLKEEFVGLEKEFNKCMN